MAAVTNNATVVLAGPLSQQCGDEITAAEALEVIDYMIYLKNEAERARFCAENIDEVSP